nr:unnamed protein product [Callosobruchus analis]
MEVDATSSGSSDENYTTPTYDDLYFYNYKWDNLFCTKKADQSRNKEYISYYKKADYANTLAALKKCDLASDNRPTGGYSYDGKKTSEENNGRRVQMDYYSGGNSVINSVVTSAKKTETVVQLNGVEGYGKKPISFSSDQVSIIPYLFNLRCVIFVYNKHGSLEAYLQLFVRQLSVDTIRIPWRCCLSVGRCVDDFWELRLCVS